MNWVERSIDEISVVVTKGTTPSTYGMPFTESGINFVKAESLNGDVNLERNGFAFINEETHAKLKRSQLAEKDVLITIAGANVGKCGFVRARELPANTNQAVGIIRVKPDIADARFIYYLFKNPKTYAMCQSVGGGQAAQPNINLTTLKNFKFLMPDLKHQERITQLIGAYDDLIENNKRRIALLEESARQLYKEWFVRFRFPGHEHVKIVDGVPEGWDRAQVGDLLTLQRGFDLPLKARQIGEIPIYASTGINGYHNEHKVEGPGIVTGRSGSLGSVMFISGKFWPLNTTLWVKEFKKVTPYYALFFLRQLKLENYNGGAAVPTLNRNDVHRIETFAPPASLMDYFSDFVTPLFEQIDGLVNQNKKLTNARDLLLPKLMSGELAV